MDIRSELPRAVRIVEVGPRDGLQNERRIVPTDAKVRFIDMLSATGLSYVEATSFVHQKAVPQLSDAAEVMRRIQRPQNITFSALVPNIRGLQRAIESDVREIAVFTAATDSFARHNINMTVGESLDTFREVISEAESRGIRVRGYVSTAFGCPYEGRVPPERVREVATRLLEMGVYEVSLGDTIGVATPNQVPEVVGPLLEIAGAERVAIHFHDTRGTALANALAALLLGVKTLDASAGGLGGCPYAPGASGNLATEDLLYMLHGMGIETGVSLDGVARASAFLLDVLGKPPSSRYLQSLVATGSVHSED